MNVNTAQMDLMVSQVDIANKEWIDVVTILTNRGLPSEIVMRLEDLWHVTKIIGKQVYEIGKIIVMKIIDFVMKNPNMVIGAIIGMAVGSLANLIPIIGYLLAPLLMALGAAGFALAGHRLDKINKDEISSYQDSDLPTDMITMLKEMWKGLVEIFEALKEYFI